jgi:hypothetical protein
VTIRGPFAIVLLLLLFASLSLNFLIGGFVVARANAPIAAADVERMVSLAVRGFPPEIQRTIADTTKAKGPQIRASLEAVQQSRQKMYDAMRAQPFNQVTLDAAFAEYRSTTVALQKVGQDMVGQALAQVPPDVRRRIKPPGSGAGPNAQNPPPPAKLPLT